MHVAPTRLVALAFLLSVLAGYVDALGFITLNGVFVSFMSGNSTRLGVAAGTPSLASTAAPASMIAAFLLGVIGGSLVARLSSGGRMPRVIALGTLLLTGAAIFHTGHPQAAAACMAAAMGALNNTFERDGEVFIGVTYMTGTLVKMGQHVAAALRGESRTRWLRYAMLWLGLTSGACLGAIAYRLVALDGLWIAAGAAAILAASSRGLEVNG